MDTVMYYWMVHSFTRHRSVNFINFPIKTFYAFKKTFLVADCQTRMFGNVI